VPKREPTAHFYRAGKIEMAERVARLSRRKRATHREVIRSLIMLPASSFPYRLSKRADALTIRAPCAFARAGICVYR
jgi:hypothetical protein